MNDYLQVLSVKISILILFSKKINYILKNILIINKYKNMAQDYDNTDWDNWEYDPNDD